MARALLWLRCDLRLHDNVVFAEAMARVRAGAVAEVLPVYVFDERQFRDTGLGFAKTGALRTRFLLESVLDLKAQLRTVGSDLLVAVGRPETVLPQLLLGGKGKTVILAQREVTSEELSIDAHVKRACGPKAALELLWGATMIHLDDLPFPAAQTPSQFTSFRKKVEENSQPRALLPTPTPGQLPLPKGAVLFGSYSLEYTPAWEAMPTHGSRAPPPAPDGRGVHPFPGGERAALARLTHYLDTAPTARHAARYFETRNGMLGADYSTKFAPWLSLGCLSPRTVYHRVKEFERATGISNQSTYWILFEMLWRDFFRFFSLRHGNKIFLAGGTIDSPTRWPRDMALFHKWVTGQTGAPLVDACMRELAETGFMSNRGRQNVASALIHDLGVDWRLGAMYFESTLLDYDVCSNWGNWVSAAGLTGGRVNFFNTAKQALEYDPDGAFVRHWIPALARIPGALIHGPHRMSAADLARHGVVLGTTYPAPLVRPRPVPVAAAAGGGGGGGKGSKGQRGAGSASRGVGAGSSGGEHHSSVPAAGAAAAGAAEPVTAAMRLTDKRGGRSGNGQGAVEASRPQRGARSLADATGTSSTARPSSAAATAAVSLDDPEGIAGAGPHTAATRWSQARYQPPPRPFQPRSDLERYG